MRKLKEEEEEVDQSVYIQEPLNDINNPNGNKLRTYRLFKDKVEAEQFVLCHLPRPVRSTIVIFRSVALPLAIEISRYSRPLVPLQEII